MGGSRRSRGLGRREFLKGMAAFAGGAVSLGWALAPAGRCWAAGQARRFSPGRHKLIFVAIDGLNPRYLELDSRGVAGGSEGDWLMPNIRSFLGRSVWYPNAKCHLPSATDMNHLNALAGTSSAQTGILSVWAQPVGWTGCGVDIRPTSLTYARDDRGRPVDTLFSAWKRTRPDSKTLFITGKEWVGNMFRQAGKASGVDILVTGTDFPPYLDAPRKERFADPATDPDAACDPESSMRGYFAGPMRTSDVLSRLYSGQGSLLTMQMEHFPNHFPHDRWIVESTLAVFKRTDPDLAYILLAQCDDAGHCIGNAPDPDEFVESPEEPSRPDGCPDKPEYRLVSTRNGLLHKEAILDAVRDVDIQFGRLMKGLEDLGVLEKAVVVLLSDHSSVNHLWSDDFSSTDCVGILEEEGVVAKRGVLDPRDMYAFSVSSYGMLYWRENRHRASIAKRILLAHRAQNPQTGAVECPWWVLDRDDMRNGLDGVSLPGELHHTFYVDVDKERALVWPDLVILARNGWQIPVYNGHVPNVGIKAPAWAPPWRVYIGGHGSVDTLPIVAAVSAPGGKTGAVERPVRIADLGVSAASLFGLELTSTTVGRDLSGDIV